jgi:putative membrane protein
MSRGPSSPRTAGRSPADVVRHLWPGRTLFCTDPVDNHLVLGDLRQWFDPEKTPRAGENPDYRFSLANERTFLAWIRTGLALIAGGLACAQFLPPLPIEYLREIISIALLLLGGLVALRAVDHWARTERAMRTGADLPGSRFPAILSIVVAAGALLLVVAVLIRALA